MLAEVLFYCIVIYLIYKIVFDFILPVAHTGRQMRHNFQNRQESQRPTSPEDPSSGQQRNHKGRSKAGDYIDFEEVKK